MTAAPTRVFKQFGKYFLLERIAQGGMAEIYLARYAVPDSGSRLMAIKCLLSDLEHAETIAEMFRSEVKILLALKHPGIVQFYDFGDGSGTRLNGKRTPYIAMDYLEGRSLRKLFISLKKSNGETDLLPVGLSVGIIDECAKALHYVHGYKDPLSGKPLEIIHRDVTPQNIILQFDGSVKLIDFGVAKVTGWGDSTAPGIIKGTPAYLSPEQAKTGVKIDHRSDQFSLAIVLWEMLTGRRLFRTEETKLTLDRISESHKHVVAPSKYRAGLGPEMDFVLMRALSHNRDDRFPSMEDFRKGLRNASTAMGVNLDEIDFGALLRTYLDKAYGAEERQDRKRIQALNEEAEAVIRSIVKPDETTDVSGAEKAPRSGISIESAVAGAPVRIGDEFQLGPPPSVSEPRHPGDRQPPSALEIERPRAPVRGRGKARRRFRWPRLKSALRGLALGIALIFVLLLYLSDSERGAQSKGLQAFRAAVDGWVASVLPRTPPTTTEPLVPPANEQPPVPLDAAKLVVEVVPPGKGTTIRLNGRFLVPSLPTTVAEVSRDEPFTLSVTRPGWEPFETQTTWSALASGSGGEAQLRVRLTPMRFGLLTVKSTLSATVTLRMDGFEWKRTDPIVNEKFPLGPLTVEVVNETLGRSRTVRAEIREGRITTLNLDLSIPTKP